MEIFHIQLTLLTAKGLRGMTKKAELFGMIADIIAAYVSRHELPPDQLPILIRQVYNSLSKISLADSEAAMSLPAISPKLSVTPDYIICLEDGQKFRSLRRHLRSKYNLTPEAYREKWGLPETYPMVAPNYTVQRSKLAKEIGLGRKSRRRRKGKGTR